MIVSVFEGEGEVLIFPTDGSGEAIGSYDYFEKGGRKREDYDIQLVELPLVISTRLCVDADRILAS